MITLTLLPALLAAPPRVRSEPSSIHSPDLDVSPTAARRPSGTSGSDDLFHLLPLPIQASAYAHNAGFVGKLVGAIAREFGGLLKWELHVSTMVEFNEVGKFRRYGSLLHIEVLALYTVADG